MRTRKRLRIEIRLRANMQLIVGGGKALTLVLVVVRPQTWIFFCLLSAVSAQTHTQALLSRHVLRADIDSLLAELKPLQYRGAAELVLFSAVPLSPSSWRLASRY